MCYNAINLLLNSFIIYIRDFTVDNQLLIRESYTLDSYSGDNILKLLNNCGVIKNDTISFLEYFGRDKESHIDIKYSLGFIVLFEKLYKDICEYKLTKAR